MYGNIIYSVILYLLYVPNLTNSYLFCQGHEEEILESGQQHKSEINLHQTESITPHVAQEGEMHQSTRNILAPSDKNATNDRTAQIQQDVSYHMEHQSSQEFVHLHSTPVSQRDTTLENVDEGNECKSPDVALQWEVVQTTDVPDIIFEEQSRNANLFYKKYEKFLKLH